MSWTRLASSARVTAAPAPEKRTGSALILPLFSRFVPAQHQEERRSVKHILFSAWPDHQTPESAGPLLRLVAEVEDSPETAASAGPVVVHCRYVPLPRKPFLPTGPLLGRSLSRAGPGRPRSYLDRHL